MNGDGGRLIDVSHSVEDGMITYKGLPAPIVCDYLSREESGRHYADGVTFQIGKLEMVANTGTYIDSPFHRYETGKDLSQLPLSNLADLNGLVVDAEETAIGPQAFDGLDVKGRAVLVHTGWDRHWGTDQYFEGHPYLTGEAAQFLRDAGASLVGIDSHNIDNVEDGARPVHSTLLAAEIPIIEHMCRLEQLPESGFRFHAVPVKVRGFGSFPVRAYGIVQEGERR